MSPQRNDGVSTQRPIMNRLIRVPSNAKLDMDATAKSQLTNSVTTLRPVTNRLQRVPSRVGLTRSSSSTSVIATAANARAAPHGSGPSAMPFNYHLPRMPSQVSLGGRGNYNETPRQSLSRSTSRTSFQTSGPRSSGLLDVPSVFSMADQMEKVMPLPSNQFVPPGRVGSRFSLATTRSNYSQSTMASRNQFTSSTASMRRDEARLNHDLPRTSVRPSGDGGPAKSLVIASTEFNPSVAQVTARRQFDQFVMPDTVEARTTHDLISTKGKGKGKASNMASTNEAEEKQVTDSTRSVALVRPQAIVEAMSMMQGQNNEEPFQADLSVQEQQRTTQDGAQVISAEKQQITTQNTAQVNSTEDQPRHAPVTSLATDIIPPQTTAPEPAIVPQSLETAPIEQAQTTEAEPPHNIAPVTSLAIDIIPPQTMVPESAIVPQSLETVAIEQAQTTEAEPPHDIAPNNSQPLTEEQLHLMEPGPPQTIPSVLSQMLAPEEQTEETEPSQAMTPDNSTATVAEQPSETAQSTEPEPSQAQTPEIPQATVEEQPHTTRPEPAQSTALEPSQATADNSRATVEEQPYITRPEQSTASELPPTPPEHSQPIKSVEESKTNKPTRSDDVPSAQIEPRSTEESDSETSKNTSPPSDATPEDIELEEKIESPTASSAVKGLQLASSVDDVIAGTSKMAAKSAATRSETDSLGGSGDAPRSELMIVGEKRPISRIIASTEDDDISIIDEIPPPSKMPPPKKIPKLMAKEQKATDPTPTRMMTRSMLRRTNATLTEPEVELRESKSDNAVNKKSKRR